MTQRINPQNQVRAVTHFPLDNIHVVFYLGSAFFKKSKSKPGGTYAHEHAWYELHCVRKGAVEIRSNEQTYIIRANEALFLPPRTYHISRILEEGTRHISFGFELTDSGKETSENLYQVMTEIFSKTACKQLVDCRTISGLARELQCYFRAGGRIHDCRVHTMLSTFLFSLFDRLSDGSSGENEGLQQPVDIAENERHYLLDILTTNQINHLTLDQLSQTIYLNKKQINQIVKKRYNMTYKQKQIQFRIENAKKQLSESTLPVDLIAQQVGYTNLTSFYKAFRKIVGMTPAEYRKHISK